MSYIGASTRYRFIERFHRLNFDPPMARVYAVSAIGTHAHCTALTADATDAASGLATERCHRRLIMRRERIIEIGDHAGYASGSTRRSIQSASRPVVRAKRETRIRMEQIRINPDYLRHCAELSKAIRDLAFRREDMLLKTAVRRRSRTNHLAGLPTLCKSFAAYARMHDQNAAAGIGCFCDADVLQATLEYRHARGWSKTAHLRDDHRLRGFDQRYASSPSRRRRDGITLHDELPSIGSRLLNSSGAHRRR